MTKLSPYYKSLVALIAGGLGWWDSITGGPSHISATEWHRLGVIVATALGVYAIPNLTGAAKRAANPTATYSVPPGAVVGGKAEDT